MTKKSPSDSQSLWTPTKYIDRIGEALELLCGGNRPPDEIIFAYFRSKDSTQELQDWCATHGPSWAQGIGVIDAAQVLADQPTEILCAGGPTDDHEHYDEFVAWLDDQPCAISVVGRLRWKKKTKIGLSIGGPKGSYLHDGKKTYAWVSQLSGGCRGSVRGWYFVCPTDPLGEYANTWADPAPDEATAKAQAMSFVKARLKTTSQATK